MLAIGLERSEDFKGVKSVKKSSLVILQGRILNFTGSK